MALGTNMMSKSYDIPIVLFTFKRTEKLLLIIDRIAEIKPKKVYIISDGGRTPEEHLIVEQSRSIVEKQIKWDCEIIKRYASENIGVYENIGGGARWVFEHEEYAIFLEDDNLPDLTFFPFCEEMLKLYKDDTRILWICGTNYLKEYQPQNGASYMFTQHMLPCGWASWANKFTKFYDGELNLWKQPIVRQRVALLKYDSALKRQDMSNWDHEVRRRRNNGRFASWDYQMGFSIRVNGLYGIVPQYNQIENIGVDMDSIHGGTSFSNIMTRRFCGISTKSLKFPLNHPQIVQTDVIFEKQTAKIITLPFKYRIRQHVSSFLKKICSVDEDSSITETYLPFLKKLIK